MHPYQPHQTIWHLDLDSFYVSAERLRNSALNGVPVAVGGSGPRSVISSASYEARAMGVRSAMPTARALKNCPNLILCPPDFSYYSGLSKKVFSLLDSFTPIWEPVSIDEAYLDMTGSESLFGRPHEAAQKLRTAILKTTGLNASIGISTNRLVAKVATDRCKPNNVLVIEAGQEAEFLAPLDVAKLPGVGRVTHEWLVDRNIKTIGQLARYPRDVLEKHLGKFGSYLHEAAWGRGSTEFHEEAKNPSISRETTFETDVDDPKIIETELWQMAADLGRSLRSQNVFARTMRLKLRYPPFHTVTRSRVMKTPTQNDRAIFEAALILLEDNWQNHSPLRLIGIGCVVGSGEHQLDIFSSPNDDANKNKIDALKDALTKRFGPNALKYGRDIQ